MPAIPSGTIPMLWPLSAAACKCLPETPVRQGPKTVIYRKNGVTGTTEAGPAVNTPENVKEFKAIMHKMLAMGTTPCGLPHPIHGLDFRSSSRHSSVQHNL